MAYDMYIESITLDDDTFKGRAFLTFGDYNNSSGVGVRGVQKLVARFIKCFFTPKGSDLSDPEYGTSLMGAFLGNVHLGAVAQLATQAVQEAFDILREYDIEYDLDDDERLASVDLENLYVDDAGGGVSLRVKIQNVIGEEALFTVRGFMESRNG